MPETDECVREWLPTVAIECVAGDVVAEPIERAGGAKRGVISFAAGVFAGLAIDFQYVSTAPPISNVTPLKGVTTFTVNET